MSETAKQGKLFVKEVVARLKGDDAEVKAVKISRKALSSVQSQIASLASKEVDLELAVEEATEKLATAKYPTTMITSSQSYVQGIKDAQDNLDAVVEELECVQESKEYFETLLKSF